MAAFPNAQGLEPLMEVEVTNLANGNEHIPKKLQIAQASFRTVNNLIRDRQLHGSKGTRVKMTFDGSHLVEDPDKAKTTTITPEIFLRCLHDLEELSVLEEACIIELLLKGHDGRLGPSEEGGGSSASGRACSEQELLELASRRCEVHRSEAQGLKWSESLEAISKDVARDLQTWFAHQRLNLSGSVAGSSRRLGVSQQRYSETIASIHELDQVLAKLRLVRLQVMGGDQGLAVVAADSLPLFWRELPFLVRCAFLQATTVCGICSLLYLLNLHKLTASVVRSMRGSSSSSCATASRKGPQQAELRDEDQVSELPGHGRDQEVEEQHELDDEQHRGAAGFVQEVEEANIGPDALSYFFEKVGEEAPDAEVAQPSLLADARSQGSNRASSKESGARAGDAASGTSSALLRQIPTSTSECGRNGYQGAESRSLFQGEWQLQRLENFAEEYYPARNPKMHGLRRHMSGFQIFGDIMEDLWGGEPLELSFMHLRKLEGRLLQVDRIVRHLAAAEDAASDSVLLPSWSAVEFDEVASCGGSSWAASELLSERDEVCSSTTSAVCAAEKGRAEEAPSSRASSANSERDLEMQSRDGDEWLAAVAARNDHLHDQRRKLKKEMVEPLVAFIPASEGAKFLRGLETTKAIYVMHLEKRSPIGLDGCSGRSKGASATTAGETAQEDESCTPKDDELELVATRLAPGFGTAEVAKKKG
eukprot:g4837.t1